jgi:acylglycerol lipase
LLLVQVSLPLLVLHGAADQVTDPSISQILFEKAKSKDKTIQLYEDAWHCLLLGEPDDVVKRVMKDIISWLDTHSSVSKIAKPESETFEQDSRGTKLEERAAIAAETLIRFGKLEVVQ